MKKPISEHTEEECDQDHQDESYDTKWGPILCKKLAAGHASFERMKYFSEKSSLDRFDQEVHSIHWSAIQKKALLGKGAYSEVHKVEVSMDDDVTKAASLNTKKYYAIKHIKPDLMHQSEGFDVAAIDLAVEGEMLSRLRHENIIKLHGIYAGDPKTAYVDFKHGYFILIDMLENDTLAKRLEKMRRLVKRKKRGAIPTVLDLIQNVAIGIAKGLEYLHENGVILRDLKPDNIGFDGNGTPIIFDLGFARELHTVKKLEVAGSVRYMAPEMGLCQGATLASDVYSFGVLLYQLCTLEIPFKKYKTRLEFSQAVFIDNYRPNLTNISSKTIKDLISNCWDGDQSKRPSMKKVGLVLRVETALLNRESRIQKASTLRKSDRSMTSINSSLSSTGLCSISSFFPLTRSFAKRSSSSTSMPTCSTSTSIETKNSFARRNSIIRRMSTKSIDWNSNPPVDEEKSASNKNNKTFGKTLRRRNSLPSRRNSNLISSLASVHNMRESGLAASFTLNGIEELSPSDHTKHAQSNYHPNRRLGPSWSRASNDSSMSSFLSISGDSCTTDVSASNFTLGEIRAPVMGRSRRNSVFSSISSKGLFAIHFGHRSNSDGDDNAGDIVLADDCIEDLSSLIEKQGTGHEEPERAEVLTP